MGSLTTEIPASAAATTSKNGANSADTLENEAIGLDVSVRIHGSQVTAVVLDATEHVEPFEEDTSTMIVFPRGAVVKLRARVRTGHAVVLTNLGTKQTALCRIVQVNSTASAVHYVKLEFSQPEPGFWGVHFPSDDNLAAAPARESQASQSGVAAPFKPQDAPPKPVPAELPSPTVRTQPPENPLQTESKPRMSEKPEIPAKPAPLPTVNYGSAAGTEINPGISNELVPLAAAPVERPPAALKTHASIAPAPQSRANSATEPPIFDSLSTGEEIFGKEAPAVSAEETSVLKTNKKAAQVRGHSIDPSLLQSVEIPKRHTGSKILLSAAALVIVAAGAVFYVKQYRGSIGQTPAVSAPAANARSVSAVQSSAASATAAPQTASEFQATAGPQSTPSADPALAQPPVKDKAISATPVHNASRNATSQSHPTISTGLADIYAGDLTARPNAREPSRASVQTPAPSLNSLPRNLGAASSNAALSSLVGGSSIDSSLPKPVEPKAVVRGGVVIPPKVIHTVQPAYPPLATAGRVEGDVQIDAFIDQTGKVISTKVVSGPVLLRSAAMDAVRQWRYSPALLDGKPISTQYKVTVSFRLGQ